MSLPAMGDIDLTPDEAKTLGLIVRGHHQCLRAYDLVKLNLLRLIMTRGTTTFEPTALGCAWYRQHTEDRHGGKEEGSKKGQRQEGGPQEDGKA
ncbi:hypothetical protein [Reyranella massiliensis]|uniref:hypothetical protein n=1 Tax=Reyranella massiliensis TaxID=445220 RepID=UPI0002D58642|nr:hypothetical protein [Reyranella massiliensis]